MKKRKRNRRIIIGVTGSFGSGKSTVAKILKSFGCEVIDADKIAHDFLRRKSPVFEKIIENFGRGILNQDKEIDRGKLAKIIFGNKRLVKKINSIIHPAVIRKINSGIRKTNKSIVVLDVPLLIEARLTNLVDYMIVVKSSVKNQVKRVQKKARLSKEEVLKRIRHQIPLRVKARLADFIIDNNGSMAETRKQVTDIRRKLWRN